MPQISAVGNTLVLAGEITAATVPRLQKELSHVLRQKKVSHLDASGIARMDSAGVAFWEELVLKLSKRGPLTIQPSSEEIRGVLDSFRSLDLEDVPRPREPGWLERIGGSVVDFWSSFKDSLYLASDVFYWSIVGIWDRHAARKGSLAHQCIVLGQNALPIVGLLSFIVGFIISLQGAIPLRDLGGGHYLANILAFGMVNELAPLFTAIIVAGRSGSAIASEIATMKVTEELDALRMMALNPVRYVVVPKFHALTLMMPLLVTFSILLGELGGAIIALGYLGISPEVFISRSVSVLGLSDFLITYAKSIVFAWLIVIIGAHYGFRVAGGAEGVGRSTTSSVVASILAVIIADAVFSLLYL